MNATSIRSSLLLIRFSISAWEARKQDKRASREVAEKHETEANVGRYHKDLLPGAIEHEQILKLRGEWRGEHYRLTLPWDDSGERVTRSSNFFEYAEMYRAKHDQWNTLLEQFLTAYPSLVAKAELRLNTLFVKADYPEVDEVRRRFAVRMTTDTIPNAEDFRILDGIPPDEVDALIAAQSARLTDQMNVAVRDLWARMSEVVGDMTQRLAVPLDPKGKAGAGGRFHDTLVSNIEELLSVLPKLNITGDPEIQRAADAMRDLVKHPAETLRISPDVRLETQRKAAALAERMKAYV